MKWWKKVAEKWRKFIEETAKANEQMWKGREPSCCEKEKTENYCKKT